VTTLNDLHEIQLRLGLSGEYLSSASMKEELKREEGQGEEKMLAGENVRLLLLFDLSLLSPSAFSATFDSAFGDNLPLFRSLAARKKSWMEAFQHPKGSRDFSPYSLSLFMAARYRKLLQLAKRREFEEFEKVLQQLQGEQDEIYASKMKELLGKAGQIEEEKDLAQLSHRRRVVEELMNLQKTCFSLLLFFARRKLFDGIKLVDRLLLLHNQIMQIFENSLAVIFVGLLKTGKSTIVDTFVGQNLCPIRLTPMTAIPIRYLHDPEREVPLLHIPFTTQLNLAIKKMKKLIDERGKQDVCLSLQSHLQKLVDMIQDGFLFEERYEGQKEIHWVTVTIHDLYRLAVQHNRFQNIYKYLPRHWNYGLDSFLTVTLRLPCLGSRGKGLNFSIVDTPGLDEEGVKKLDLAKVILDSVELCHYVVFTLSPHSTSSTQNTIFRSLVRDIEQRRIIPTSVFVTQIDSLPNPGEDLKSLCENLSRMLGGGMGEDFRNYDPNKIYPVSGRQKLYADKMLRYLEKNGEPPLESDEDPEKRDFARDWALHTCQGFDEEEKCEMYKMMAREGAGRIRAKCETLLEISKMNPPTQTVLQTSLDRGGYLSCNKAIDHSLRNLQDLFDFVDRIMKIYNAERNRVNNLSAICSEVATALKKGIVEIRESLNSRIHQFKKDITRKMITSYQAVLENHWEIHFAYIQTNAKQEAESLFTQALEEIKEVLTQEINKILLTEQKELNRLSSRIQKETETALFSHLRRIFQEISITEELFPFNLNFPEITIDPDLGNFMPAERAVVNILPKVLTSDNKIRLDLAHNKISEFLHDFVDQVIQLTTQKVLKFLNGVVDSLFIKALRDLNQIRVALAEREALLPHIDEVSSFYDQLKDKENNLKALLNPEA